MGKSSRFTGCCQHLSVLLRVARLLRGVRALARSTFFFSGSRSASISMGQLARGVPKSPSADCRFLLAPLRTRLLACCLPTSSTSALRLTAPPLLDLHIHNVPPNAEPLTQTSLSHLVTIRLGVLLDLMLGLQTRPSISLLSGLLRDLLVTLAQDVLLVVVLADRLVLDLHPVHTAHRTVFFLSMSRALAAALHKPPATSVVAFPRPQPRPAPRKPRPA
mmetsp:Transcript_112739/g.358199  ORF Transcript_112739/g.358199 Transcript_112739/m.358199 type:complete len:219 (-) Transcript_112739:954-1610(-)